MLSSKCPSNVYTKSLQFLSILSRSNVQYLTDGAWVDMQVLAKEIIHSRKAVGRLYVNKAHMISISNALTEQLGKYVERVGWLYVSHAHMPRSGNSHC